MTHKAIGVLLVVILLAASPAAAANKEHQQLMADIRAAIANGTFEAFKNQTRADWARGDIAPR